jgi:hypothetical protein
MTIEIKTFTNMLPAAPGRCPECATEHPPEQPHNRQSMFYQYSFCQQHGRWPTWNDAMSHCSPATQRQWREGLREIGVDVPELEQQP